MHPPAVELACLIHDIYAPTGQINIADECRQQQSSIIALVCGLSGSLMNQLPMLSFQSSHGRILVLTGTVPLFYRTVVAYTVSGDSIE